MNEQPNPNVNTQTQPYIHIKTPANVCKPRILAFRNLQLTVCYKPNSDTNLFPKMSINRILIIKPNRDNIYYKELLFDGKNDLLRRYYTRESALRRKGDLFKMYQFAIPKPKIYSMNIVKLHFRYYYIRRKLREEALRDLLLNISDDGFKKLDLIFLENYVKERNLVLSEYITT